MTPDELSLVGVDDHVVEPPHRFAGRVASRFRVRAPRVVRRPDGSDVWIFDKGRFVRAGRGVDLGDVASRAMA